LLWTWVRFPPIPYLGSPGFDMVDVNKLAVGDCSSLSTRKTTKGKNVVCLDFSQNVAIAA